MLRWLKIVSGPTANILYGVGLLAVVVGLYFGTPADTAAPWYSRVFGILEPLGYSIIITTLVASALNHSFQAAIEDRFSIIKGAEGARVQRLYSDREQAVLEIESESERANFRIDILCISGTDLLQPKTKLLAEIGRRFRDRSGIGIRVLLLDPRSRYAVERSIREEGESFPPKAVQAFDYPNKKLCEDTLLALRQLQKVVDEAARQAANPFRLSVRLYNSAPMMFYVALDDRVYLEQYHLGVPKSQSNIPFTRCLGKAVSVIEVPSDSEIGRVMGSHFEYLWQRSASRELRPGSYDYLVSSLNLDSWLDKTVDIDASDEQELSLALNASPNTPLHADVASRRR